MALLGGVVSCTLSVSDNNPKNISFFGTAGLAKGSVANGELTLTGSNLNYVTSVSLAAKGESSVDLGPITTRTYEQLTVGLPPALKLPGMLLVSTAAQATEYPLSTLDALTVDGSLAVTGDSVLTGTTDLGIEKVQSNCAPSTGFCSVACPAGKKVITGGCFVSTAGVGLSANYPSGDNQWTCRPTASSAVDAYVICARVNMVY